METKLSKNFGDLETLVLVSYASPIGLLTLYCNVKLVYFLPYVKFAHRSICSKAWLSDLHKWVSVCPTVYGEMATHVVIR